MKLVIDFDTKPEDEENLKRALEDGDYAWVSEIVTGMKINSVERIKDAAQK